MFLQTIFSQLHQPGEGQRPIPILTDEGFEQMCNPAKYPTGKFGFMASREKKLTVRRYFNQRLLDADGRFCKDVEYLLKAQYAVENKQVADAPIQRQALQRSSTDSRSYSESECAATDDPKR